MQTIIRAARQVRFVPTIIISDPAVNNNTLMNMRMFDIGPERPSTDTFVSDYTKAIASRMARVFPKTDEPISWDSVGRYLYRIGGHGLNTSQKLILAGVLCETNPNLSDIILQQSVSRDAGWFGPTPRVYREGI